jgi:hypothetical protein
MTKPTNFQPSSEDVLYAFAVEPISGRSTLEQYLRDYPQYAAELVDLSYELSRDVSESEMPLSEKDLALIDSGWERYANTVDNEIIDPLMSMSVDEQRTLAKLLGIPRQVITAFRERRVKLDSVPNPFLERFASMANSTVETVFINAPKLLPKTDFSNSYKAKDKPNIQASITFEQLLIEAGVPPEQLTLLMKDENQDE